MKIVLVSFLYEPEIGGGAALVVHQLAHLLVQRSHAVVVITTWKGDHVKTDILNGIKIIRIPPRNLYWVGEKDEQPLSKKIIWQMIDTWNPIVFQNIKQILRVERPDIVHVHKLRGLSPSVWSAARSMGINKIVHTCHDFELLSPQGLFMGRVGTLARQQNILLSPYQSIRRNLSRLVSTVLTPSQFVMNIHKEMGFFPHAQTGVIFNTHGFSPTELEDGGKTSPKIPQQKRSLRFLYIGRLEKEKGVNLLCEAFIQASRIKPGIVLMIAGWGSLETALRETYSTMKSIKFLGKVFGDQKEELLNSIDVMVIPSISPESFGLTITEAYAHGKPVITSNAGAFPEIVKEGMTGLMTAAGSISELSAAIVKMSEEPFLLEELSQNCRKEAYKFTSDVFIDLHLAVYQGLS